ncbi:hypothetical protein K466DRAFT_456562, partial [Polyporus arcularius HHB13444]
HPETSTYTLDLPPSSNMHPTYHASLLCPYLANDKLHFLAHVYTEPGPIVTLNGQQEYYVKCILD